MSLLFFLCCILFLFFFRLFPNRLFVKFEHTTQFSRGPLDSKTAKVPLQPPLTSDLDLFFRTFIRVFMFSLIALRILTSTIKLSDSETLLSQKRIMNLENFSAQFFEDCAK